MPESKLHEMFKLAMWDEHISHALYLATAGKTKDRLMKNKLLYLAADEKAHNKVGFPSPAETGFMKSDSELNFDAFLAFAMEKESSALNFYLKMSDHLGHDSKASATMLHFSAMEGDHYSLLKTELEKLRRGTA